MVSALTPLLDPDFLQDLDLLQELDLPNLIPESQEVLEFLLSHPDLLPVVIQPYWFDQNHRYLVLTLLFPPTYLKKHSTNYPPPSSVLFTSSTQPPFQAPPLPSTSPKEQGRAERGTTHKPIQVLWLSEPPKPHLISSSALSTIYSELSSRSSPFTSTEEGLELIPDTDLIRKHLLSHPPRALQETLQSPVH